MHIFTGPFFSGLLLVPAVLAVPSSLGFRVSRRTEARLSQPNNLVKQPDDNVFNTLYSENWAGAVWSESPETFTYITGTFTVPTPQGQSGDSGAVWVGIDGNTCQSAILQTGIAFTINDDGVAYIAWDEWYPAPAMFFPEARISAGDILKLSVVAFTSTSGVTMIENLTTGQTLSNVTSGVALCGQDAEWIVEDFQEDSNLVAFANFGTVTFTDAVAAGPNGVYGVSGATPIDIVKNDKIITSVKESESSLTISYL